MLIHHAKPRPDLNDGQPHEKKPASALSVMLALAQVRGSRPIKTVRVPK